MADFAYFYALSLPGAMISIVSMVRRGSVLVSFVCGAVLFRERNLKAKAIDYVFCSPWYDIPLDRFTINDWCRLIR